MHKQDLLVLYLGNSSLSSRVVGSSRYDGNQPADLLAGDDEVQPYTTGTEALRDGWRLFQASPLRPLRSGEEHQISYLLHEFWFER